MQEMNLLNIVVNAFEVNNKGTRTMANYVIVLSSLLTLNTLIITVSALNG